MIYACVKYEKMAGADGLVCLLPQKEKLFCAQLSKQTRLELNAIDKCCNGLDNMYIKVRFN